MALRTVLYPWHTAHGGRMVDFAGWDMPVQYSTIVEEHTAVRSAAGLFDISHMGRLAISGPHALALIQRVFSNNAATMKVGQVRYGLVCNDQGGIRDDVLVYRWAADYMMVVNASNRDKIVAWLAESRGSLQADVKDKTLGTCMIAVQGPSAVEICQGLTEADSTGGTGVSTGRTGVPAGPGQAGTPVPPVRLAYYFATQSRLATGPPAIVSRTGYTGEDGLEFIVDAGQGVTLWEELVRRGAKPCGLGARDTLRLEAGMPLYGHELSEEIDPLQAGLSWAVKLDKGDFCGRDALLRRQQDASRRQRVGLELQGKRIAREGAVVKFVGKEAGLISSGTFSPTLGKTIAMAYVDATMQKPGTSCQVDIRGKEEAAQVVALPFYRRPK